MSTFLTNTQIDIYQRDGFLFPIDVLTPGAAADIRAQIEDIERREAEFNLPLELNQYFRVNTYSVLPFIAEITRNRAVLDAVEGILGPDLLVWSAELFIKEAKTPKIVSWHQDLTYWGLGETDEQLTAWIALSDVSEASGCMRFVAGSHHQRIVPHNDTFAADNLLSRGQEIAVEVDEKDAVMVELKPGQMSLHHGRMFHASGPNVSDDRRIGLAIRYVTPGVKQLVAERDYAMLVRGCDRYGNWINIAPPVEAFSPYSLSLYREIMAAQAQALGQGADHDIPLYAGAKTL